MANMDDYYRAKLQAKEDDELDNAKMGDEPGSDEIIGTRSDVEAAIDDIAYDDVTSSDARENDSFHLHDENAVGSANEAKPSPTERTADERPADVIELIQRELESACEWLPLSEQHDRPPISPYSTIGDVSRAFTLNQRQHVAFTLVGTALLERFKQQELANTHESTRYRTNEFESRLRDDLLMFLGGAGGTGKSRVVDAIDAFCSRWHRSNCIVKTALTGKAATLIGGRTLASFMVRLKHAIKKKQIAPLDVLVIDEVSMMSKSEWLKLDKLLRRYMQIENVPFGGIHIVLVGDFLQMPPVKSDPIYVDPVNKAKPSTADVEGFELWRKITTVVVLEESVRFRNDPEWGEGCRNARLGVWTSEFIGMTNARVIQGSENDATQSPQDEPGASAVSSRLKRQLAWP